MNEEFKAHVDSLHEKYLILINAKPYASGDTLPKSGVYMFMENGVVVYIGRSDSIPKRYHQHRRKSSDFNSASFAVRLAREKTKNFRKNGKTLKKLKEDAEFVNAFNLAKAKIRLMEFRAVAESDPTCQALLEIYCAIATNAKHNSFENH